MRDKTITQIKVEMIDLMLRAAHEFANQEINRCNVEIEYKKMYAPQNEPKATSEIVDMYEASDKYGYALEDMRVELTQLRQAIIKLGIR